MNLTPYHRKDWLEPFDFITDLQDDVNRLFSTSLRRQRDDIFSLSPQIDLEEDEHGYTVRADLPGIKKAEIDIQVTGNTLTLKGERKEETEKKNKNFFHRERLYGSFARVIEFPSEINAGLVKAAYKDGVLEISVPKSENAKPKQIKVDIQS